MKDSSETARKNVTVPMESVAQRQDNASARWDGKVIGAVILCSWMNLFIVISLSIEGHHCDRPCDEGTFGKDCKEQCDCRNNGTCNPQSGQCRCSAGWTGEHCEQKCPFGHFGFNCAQKCDCNFNNSITCDAVDGRCICKSPWSGQYSQQNYIGTNSISMKRSSLHVSF